MIDNFIGTYDSALSESQCMNIISLFDRLNDLNLTYTRQQLRTAPRHVVSDTNISVLDSSVFNLSNAGYPQEISCFLNNFWDFYTDYVSFYSTIALDPSKVSLTDIKIQKTNIGEGYHIWHYENSHYKYSNRFLAWMIYLNDVEEGGETEFLYQNMRVKPKTGTLLIWPAGFTHTHRGNQPLSGTKYIMTGWIEHFNF